MSNEKKKKKKKKNMKYFAHHIPIDLQIYDSGHGPHPYTKYYRT